MRKFKVLDTYALGASPASVSSDAFGLGDATMFALQIVCTGDLVATVALKSSLDLSHYDAVGDVSLPNTAGAGSQSADLSLLNADSYQFSLARTGGSGNVTIWVCIKGNV